MNIFSFRTAFAVLFFLIIQTTFGFGQQKYEYYTSKKSDNSKRQFVNLEQFRVPATSQYETTRRNSGTSNRQQSVQEGSGIRSQPAERQLQSEDPSIVRAPFISVPRSVQPGIRPQLLGRAVTRNQFNYNFINQAQYSDGTLQGDIEVVTWRTPNFSHQTLYFEEPNLERYGISKGQLQPFYSAYHFFGSVAAMPYSLAARSPNCCTSTIGNCRPGNCCQPWKQSRLPLDRKATATQVMVLGAILAAM